MKMMIKTPYSEADHFVSSTGADPQSMFNATVSSATTHDDDLVVVLNPGSIGAIGLAGMRGGTLSVVGSVSGSTVFEYSQLLYSDQTPDWYEYFFEPFTQITDSLVSGIPPFSDIQITLTITGTDTACGVCAFGSMREIGETMYGAEVSILDYSTKETDEFGVTTLATGPFSKRISATSMMDNGIINRALQMLASARASATFFSFADGSDFAETYTVFGFYRDFSIAVNYPKQSLVSIEIEGLT